MSEIFRTFGLFVDALEPGFLRFAVEGGTDLTHAQATTLAHAILSHVQQEQDKRAAEKGPE